MLKHHRGSIGQRKLAPVCVFWCLPSEVRLYSGAGKRPNWDATLLLAWSDAWNCAALPSPNGGSSPLSVGEVGKGQGAPGA